MLEFILKLLIPDYFNYQEQMKKEILKLVREVMENER